MFFVLLVLHDNEQLEDVLNAWEKVGVPGITILPSSGLSRFRNGKSFEEMPLLPSLDDFFCSSEIRNSTLFSIVDNELMVDRIIAATESVIGDLDLPDTGIMVVLPVLRAYGLNRKPAE